MTEQRNLPQLKTYSDLCKLAQQWVILIFENYMKRTLIQSILEYTLNMSSKKTKLHQDFSN
jgi:hypothetical protein